MSKVTFSFNLSEAEQNLVNCASEINEEELLSFLKTKLMTKSQEIVINFASTKLYETKLEPEEDEELLMKDDYKEDYVDNEDIEFSFKYANKDWMKRALNALLDAKKQNVFLTTNDIFNLAGVSEGARKNLRTSLGRFLKKSGVKCRKRVMNGTTVTDYYI